MKVIVDCHTTFVEGELEKIPGIDEVVYLPPERIDRDAVKDADALIVRTRTRCDSQLLDGSKVGLVATATIGLDHLDTDYLDRRGIYRTNAPGCNAPAVAQWVFAAIGAVKGMDTNGLTLGVVGAGNVGSLVCEWGKRLGMRVLANDPPRAASEEGDFVPLDEIAAQSDIITFHPTLNPTSYHLGNREFFNACRRKPLIINASRGPVVDTEALVEALDQGQVSGAAIDTWEGEPKISETLMARAAVATPHIAGYSLQGKRRAAQAAIAAVKNYLAGKAPDKGEAARGIVPQSLEALCRSYDIMEDDRAFRAASDRMEALRDGYRLRNEYGTESNTL